MVRRLLAALWLGLGLGLMLAGIPVVLVAIFGMPLPRHPPQQPYLREWISSAAVLLLWLIWAVLLAMAWLHLRAALRRLRMPHLRLADPPEGLLAGLVSAAVVAASTAGSRGTIAAPAPPATAAPAPPPPEQPSEHAQPPRSLGAFPPGQLAAEPVPLPGYAPRTTGLSGDDGPNSASADLHRQSQEIDRGAESHRSQDPIEPKDLAANDVQSSGFGAGEPAAGGRAAETVAGAAGVALPGGGWLAPDAARNVVAAAGLLWLRRRRRYLPRPPAGSQRSDGDLTGLPETAAAIIGLLNGDDPDGPDDADVSQRGAVTTSDVAAAAAAVSERTTTTAVGYRGDGPLRPVDLPAGGVGLVGPGAPDAARGIVTALLLSGGQGGGDRDGQILTTTVDLTNLLGRTAIGDDPPSGLAVRDTLDELLAAVETYLLHGSRNQHDPTVGGGLLVVTACPRDPAVARRLAVLLTHAAGASRVNAMLLGGWSYGPSWYVNNDGTTDPDPSDSRHRSVAAGARLCVLPRQAAVDLLTLQARARPGRRNRFGNQAARADLLVGHSTELPSRHLLLGWRCAGAAAAAAARRHRPAPGRHPRPAAAAGPQRRPATAGVPRRQPGRRHQYRARGRDLARGATAPH